MKTTITLPRQQSLAMPDVQNPFVHRLHLGPLEILQVVVMSLTLAPLRLLMSGMCLVVAWLVAAIALSGRTEEEKKKPLAGWRKGCESVLIFLGRTIYFLLGFHTFSVKGRQVSVLEAPLMCIAPHSSFLDGFVFFMGNALPSTVSKAENTNIPFFGTLIQFTQPVLVKREDPDSRVNTIKEIQRRAQTRGAWPQVVIYPEGTCTNRSCLITFKQGAFYPAVPVQPVCLRYLNKLDTVTWTWDGPGAFACLWLTLCQFNNAVQIEFLPVYTPNEAEKADAKLYANNVRSVMAKCLGVGTTDHTYDDCRLMLRAQQLNLPMAAGLVEFQKLHKKLGINFHEMKTLLNKFCEIAKGNSGHISLNKFAEHLKIPASDVLEEVFTMYDRDGSGSIDFREYLIGLSLVSGPVNTEKTIQLAFQLFDTDNKGHITVEELTQILHNAFGMCDVDVVELFKKIDQDKDDKIVYDEFKAYALQHPEYANLFTSYQQKKHLANGYPEGRQKSE
ncbi:hypothetical protein ScPMuIL_000003 [Solemya velum]